MYMFKPWWGKRHKFNELNFAGEHGLPAFAKGKVPFALCGKPSFGIKNKNCACQTNCKAK